MEETKDGIQNLAEAEYIVATYMYLRVVSEIAKESIAIIASETG